MSRGLAYACMLVVGCLAARAVQAQCHYDVTIIQGPPDPQGRPAATFATGLNNLGHVCGYYNYLGDDDRAFYWTPQTGIVTIPMPPGTDASEARDINDFGVVVGSYIPPQGFGSLAFVWDGQRFTTIWPVPGGTYSDAYAINNAGRVVGVWGNSISGPIHGFVWEAGQLLNLGDELGTPSSRAFDVNELGQVTGWLGTSSLTDARAYIWDSAATIVLAPIPGGLTSEGLAIADAGQVGGSGRVPLPGGGLGSHAFLWTDGGAIDVGTLPGHEVSAAYGVTSHDVVVGVSRDFGPPLRDYAFIAVGGRSFDLNELVLDGAPSHLRVARAVNPDGEIVANTSNSALLLAPLPLAGDIDGDHQVNLRDLGILLADYGCSAGTPTLPCPGDADGDGDTDLGDLGTVLANFGIGC